MRHTIDTIDTTLYRARTSRRFRLKDHQPDHLPGRMTQENAQDILTLYLTRMRELQERLYAQDEWSLLVILQGIDAAGKDSAIEHVFSGLNPQGCQVDAFKIPSDEELDHDFLWRTAIRLPRRGNIGIFNRSYYEEVLVVRVHPDMLERQRLPRAIRTSKEIWQQRYDDIVAHERHLVRNGTVVRKIFFNLSKEEQRQRMLKRLEEPDKLWKFSASDIKERRLWDRYQKAYEQAIAATSTETAPWYVVPADRKWWTRTVIAAVIVEALEDLHLEYPTVAVTERRELETIRRALQRGSI
jgi:PPK2 family polyphosphate:nucleotide phosphotransferase